MFTLQASQFVGQLNDAGMNPRVSEILLAMLGNCSQALEHRGPVTITVESPKAEFTVGDTVVPGEGYPATGFTSISDGTYNPDTGKVKGGFAGAYHGPVFFGGPVIFGGEVIGGGSVLLAKAQTNWKKSLPAISFVPVKQTLSLAGLQEVGAEFNLYLPHTTPGDPNVTQGMVLAYALNNGVAVALSPYMDDKIGTVKLWGLPVADVPAGWKVMDGTSNASVGTGYDMRGRFAKGADGNAGAGGDHDLGSTGGDTSYTPAGTVSGSISGTFETLGPDYTTSPSIDTSISWTATPIVTDVSSNWTGTLKTNNTGNVNWLDTLQTTTQTGVPSATINVDLGAEDTSVATSDHYHEIALSNLLHHHDIAAAALDHQHAITTSELAHTHTINESSLDHTHEVEIDAEGFSFTGTEATIIPPFRNLYYIERIDNSA